MEELWHKPWRVFCCLILILSVLQTVSGNCSSLGDTGLVAQHLTATTTPQNLSYPGGGNYSASTECLWAIYASSDYVMVEIMMLDMEVDYSSCRYDSLKIYDGNLNNKVERTLCGTLDNDIPRYYMCFISSTDNALVRFASDNYVSGSGFTVQYRSAATDGCSDYQSVSSGDGDGGLKTWIIVLIVLGVILAIILIILLILLICCCCCKKKDGSTDRVTPLIEDTDSVKHEKMESEKHYTYTENHVDETKHGQDNKNEKKSQNVVETSSDRNNVSNEKTALDDRDTTHKIDEDEKYVEGHKKETIDPTSREAVAALVLNPPPGKAKKLPPIDKKDSVPMKQKTTAPYDYNKNNKNQNDGLPPVDTPDQIKSNPRPGSTPPLCHRQDSQSRTSIPRKPLQETKIFWTNLVGNTKNTGE